MTEETKTEVKEPYVYKTPEPEEITRIIQGLIGGTTFTSVNLMVDDAGDLLGSVFMPIGLKGLTNMFTQEEFEALQPVFYEHMEHAGPRSVNGYPIFMSVRIISYQDWSDLVMPKYKAAMEAIGG